MDRSSSWWGVPVWHTLLMVNNSWSFSMTLEEMIEEKNRIETNFAYAKKERDRLANENRGVRRSWVSTELAYLDMEMSRHKEDLERINSTIQGRMKEND